MIVSGRPPWVTAEAGRFPARMHWLDWMTDLVGLMLWLSWRGFGAQPASARPALTLVSNLRHAGGGGSRRGTLALPALGVLLLARAALHHTLSPNFADAVPWSMGAVTIAFRSDLWWRILSHSFLSWAALVLKAHVCFAFLVVLRRPDADSDPITQSLKAELGPAARWPWGLSMVPFLAGLGVLWLAASPVLVGAGLVPARVSTSHALQQAVVVALGGLGSLKWPLVLLCLMRFLLDHVYLGAMPVWDYLHVTGGRLSGWLAVLPLRWGRIDLAPLVAAGLCWTLGHLIQGGAPRLFLRLPL